MENTNKDEYSVRQEKTHKLQEEMIVYKDKYDVTEKLENIKSLNIYLKVQKIKYN